ncbi:leucine-rich repeat protein [Adlercreutzia sp. ZJ138]|uniref:leucine-rich repeat protein n=1 Tax=Adlercreutzia sp. ZJ138 TaxID=2709405 RepID=UPI0013EC6557|nr:leucine-rich repeat protein [Adlercreutzia sp. ZJ138]
MVQASSLVFCDKTTPIDDLVEELCALQVNLDADQVSIERAAHSVEGEVWSPQLLPYDDWTKHQDIETKVLRIEGQDDAYNEGLLAWGRLEFIDDDLREKLIAQAREKGDSEALAAAVVKRRVFDGDDDLRGAISVRQDTDGYVLVGIDIRRYAQALGTTDNLIVVLPATVDGVPIVRIAQEAFVRRLVQGVDVRLLVVPHTVRRIGGDAFAALSCRHVHLGASVETGGDQACDMAGVHPRLVSRTYTVDEHNPAYAARDGSLYSKDGETLLLFAPPYEQRCAIPEGVRRIGSAAFCAGCDEPLFVLAPETLEKVDSKAWRDAVWVCPPASAVREKLKSRGVRLASENVVEHDGCWYDFDEQGAVLVAGPPAPKSASARFAAQAFAFGKSGGAKAGGAAGGAGTSDASTAGAAGERVSGTVGSGGAAVSTRTTLVLPREIEGRPLVRIGVRALPTAPETLVIPSSVKVIEQENACLGTKRLTLSDGVRSIGAHSFRSRTLEPPVLIPASVESVGEGCFEYAVCRLAANGAVVHVPADQLLSCFIECTQREGAEVGVRGAGDSSSSTGALFDFARYDQVLLSGKNIPDRLGALLHRLAHPEGLAPATKQTLVSQARAKGRDALQYVAREGNIDMVAALLEAGFINDENFDRQIELLRACNRTDCVMFLMERHRKQEEQAGKPKSARARFAL